MKIFPACRPWQMNEAEAEEDLGEEEADDDDDDDDDEGLTDEKDIEFSSGFFPSDSFALSLKGTTPPPRHTHARTTNGYAMDMRHRRTLLREHPLGRGNRHDR